MQSESVTQLFAAYPNRGDRPVRVYVPAHEAGETLPVIYMTDGQNLFDEESSGFGCWHTREAVRAERARSGQAAIIVGIHNNDPWRANELTPKSIGEILCPEEVRQTVSPEGEVFDDFLIHTVKPMVEAQFPVKTGRSNTAFCGSSMGGLFAFFTALSHPDVFCAAGVFSPAFMIFPERDMRRWIHARLQSTLPYLYIYTGAGDELEKDICQSVERAYDILTACYPERLLHEVIQPEQRHHETAWEPNFKDFLHTFLTRREEF